MPDKRSLDYRAFLVLLLLWMPAPAAAGLLTQFLDPTDGDSKETIGGGFRYLVARRLGLKAGIDIARGPEEWAFYIQVGSAWLR